MVQDFQTEDDESIIRVFTDQLKSGLDKSTTVMIINTQAFNTKILPQLALLLPTSSMLKVGQSLNCKLYSMIS